MWYLTTFPVITHASWNVPTILYSCWLRRLISRLEQRPQQFPLSRKTASFHWKLSPISSNTLGYVFWISQGERTPSLKVSRTMICLNLAVGYTYAHSACVTSVGVWYAWHWRGLRGMWRTLFLRPLADVLPLRWKGRRQKKHKKTFLPSTMCVLTTWILAYIFFSCTVMTTRMPANALKDVQTWEEQTSTSRAFLRSLFSKYGLTLCFWHVPDEEELTQLRIRRKLEATFNQFRKAFCLMLSEPWPEITFYGLVSPWTCWN